MHQIYKQQEFSMSTRKARRTGRLRAVMPAAMTSVILAVIASPAAATGTLDQSQAIIPPTFAFAPRNVTYIAQTYTAGVTGTLDQVDLLLSRLDPLDRNLIVQIETTNGGLPSGVVLDSSQLTPSQVTVSNFPDLSFVSVPLSGSPTVAGDQYAIVVADPTATPFGGSQYLWGGASGDPYSPGEALLTFDAGASWLEQTGFDMDFKTYVTPPLPTTKDQCKNDGWRRFGRFKNEGDCISFVETSK